MMTEREKAVGGAYLGATQALSGLAEESDAEDEAKGKEPGTFP